MVLIAVVVVVLIAVVVVVLIAVAVVVFTKHAVRGHKTGSKNSGVEERLSAKNSSTWCIQYLVLRVRLVHSADVFVAFDACHPPFVTEASFTFVYMYGRYRVPVSYTSTKHHAFT